jgi:hypothetical protein
VNMIEGMNDVYEVELGVAIMVLIRFLFLFSCGWCKCASQWNTLFFIF